MAAEQPDPGSSSHVSIRVEWLVGALVLIALVVLVLLFRSQRNGAFDPDRIPEESVAAPTLAVAGFPGPPSAAVAGEIMGRLGMIKVAVAEYWISMGHPPENNLTAGLAEPESYAGRWVERVSVLSSGIIMVVAHDSSGQTFNVELRPDYRPEAGILDWRCFSNHPHIRAVLDDCTVAPD